jgi:adenine-specific DNA-methyltransferase
VIKYLGSKRRLVPALTVLAEASGATTGLDLFTGTTRVAQAWKRQGMTVTAVDSARFAYVLARCYVATDPGDRPGFAAEVTEAVDRLNALPGRAGYVTATFCEASRFFRPENGARIDAVRDAIESDYAGSDLYPVLLTSLLEAADRVDSTTGLQMAYLKQWAARSHQPLTLRVPVLLPGPGRALHGDACVLAGSPGVGPVDLAYLDPPYNQHRYDSNYHVWETIVAWDAPAHYGIACKREDLRAPAGRSAFNSRRTMPAALGQVVGSVRAEVVILSYNNESWLSFDELRGVCSARGGHVSVLAFDSARYVGARIGIHNRDGAKVGRVSHLRNTEYMLLVGDRARVRSMADAVVAAGLGMAVDQPVPVSGC